MNAAKKHIDRNEITGSSLTGTIIIPAATIVYNGTGNLNPSHVRIIGYTVEITGVNAAYILYQDADCRDAAVSTQAGLMQ